LPVIGRRRVRDLVAGDVCEVLQQTQKKKGMTLESAERAYQTLSELLDAALEQGLIATDPRVLPDDIWTLKRQAAPSFSDAEILALTGDERLDADQRLYNALALYTGLPAQQLCRLRFGQWTAKVQEPVLPELALAMQQWQRHGFEGVYGRPPADDDWVVPRRSDVTQPHTEGSAFKAFRRCCVAIGIKTRSPHAPRNTFERLARGFGSNSL
jgi:integrase